METLRSFPCVSYFLLDQRNADHPSHFPFQIWETVTEADVLTPREAYDQAAADGFKVNYARVAIVSAAAFLPILNVDTDSRVLFRRTSKHPCPPPSTFSFTESSRRCARTRT